MPTFREVLKKTIPSKTQRLLEFIKRTIHPRLENVGQRSRNILNFLRDNQRIVGFAQPRSFDLRGYQTRTGQLFNRLTGAISRFIRRIGNQSRLLVGNLNPSTRQFRMALERTIERSRNTMIDAARDLIDKRITVSEFRETLTRQIRSLHLAAAFIGIKSVTNLTPNILEEIQARTSKQLNFLEDFTQDIQEIFDKQDGLTPKQSERIVNSASKYADAARSTHSNAERLLVADTYGEDVNDDRVLGMRVLGPSEQHCFVCPDLASEFVELDQLVAIGDTPCGSSCKCHIVYARASEIAGETLPQDTSSQIL